MAYTSVSVGRFHRATEVSGEIEAAELPLPLPKGETPSCLSCRVSPTSTCVIYCTSTARHRLRSNLCGAPHRYLNAAHDDSPALTAPALAVTCDVGIDGDATRPDHPEPFYRPLSFCMHLRPPLGWDLLHSTGSVLTRRL
jgi:hypothetical protein